MLTKISYKVLLPSLVQVHCSVFDAIFWKMFHIFIFRRTKANVRNFYFGGGGGGGSILYIKHNNQQCNAKAILKKKIYPCETWSDLIYIYEFDNAITFTHQIFRYYIF